MKNLPLNDHVELVSSIHDGFLCLQEVFKVLIQNLCNRWLYLLMGHVKHFFSSDGNEEVVGCQANFGSKTVDRDLQSWSKCNVIFHGDLPSEVFSFLLQKCFLKPNG